MKKIILILILLSSSISIYAYRNTSFGMTIGSTSGNGFYLVYDIPDLFRIKTSFAYLGDSKRGFILAGISLNNTINIFSDGLSSSYVFLSYEDIININNREGYKDYKYPIHYHNFTAGFGIRRFFDNSVFLNYEVGYRLVYYKRCYTNDYYVVYHDTNDCNNSLISLFAIGISAGYLF